MTNSGLNETDRACSRKSHSGRFLASTASSPRSQKSYARRAARAFSVALAATLLAVLSAGLLGAQSGTSFQVIVNDDNPTTSMSRAEISRLMLKKMSRWHFDDKPAAHPVDQAQNSEIREAFSQEIHKRSSSAVRSYWQQRIFSGRGVPPPEAASDSEVVEYVGDDLGAIGYVAKGTALDGVKAIKITD